MQKNDLRWLRESIMVAKQARAHGNHPFGAVLVNAQGELVLSAENTVVTERDITGHAETNLVRTAHKRIDPAILAGCTLYASTEPCPMCAGAIYWANIGRIVFGLSQTAFYGLVGDKTDARLHLSCREILASGSRSVVVLGPLMENEAILVHEGFWKD